MQQLPCSPFLTGGVVLIIHGRCSLLVGNGLASSLLLWCRDSLISRSCSCQKEAPTHRDRQKWGQKCNSLGPATTISPPPKYRPCYIKGRSLLRPDIRRWCLGWLGFEGYTTASSQAVGHVGLPPTLRSHRQMKRGGKQWGRQGQAALQ